MQVEYKVFLRCGLSCPSCVSVRKRSDLFTVRQQVQALSSSLPRSLGHFYVGALLGRHIPWCPELGHCWGASQAAQSTSLSRKTTEVRVDTVKLVLDSIQTLEMVASGRVKNSSSSKRSRSHWLCRRLLNSRLLSAEQGGCTSATDPNLAQIAPKDKT